MIGCLVGLELDSGFGFVYCALCVLDDNTRGWIVLPGCKGGNWGLINGRCLRPGPRMECVAVVGRCICFGQ